MNAREIIIANLDHRDAPRPGLTFNEGRMNDMWGCDPGSPKGYTQKRWTEGPYVYRDDAWGTIMVRMQDGCNCSQVFKAAIEDWSQLGNYRPPEHDFDDTVLQFRQGLEQAGDRFTSAFIGGFVFSVSSSIRKMENYMTDLLLYPEELKQLHSKVAGVFETLIRAAGKAGANGIFFCEDMGTQQGLLFSPQLWREYFGDLYTKLFGIAHEYGMKVFMHSCGRNREILEPLLQAGVDCFQFDQPTLYDMTDLAQLLKKYKAALWSPIDIQKILPTGDRKLIEKGVEDMFAHFEGFLIFKNYPDLNGIGVKPEWDNWAYEKILRKCGIENQRSER